jgi:molecular chaperone GrpE
MEEDKRGPDQAAEERANGMSQAENAAETESVSSGEANFDPTAKLAAELEAQKAENAELKDRALRLMAEMENLRRRTERDKSEFAKYAISEFARDIVGVGDNIRRAIEAVPKDAISSDPALMSLIEGIEVTERELLKTLEKYQIKRFDPLGEPFNPHLHDAMTKVDVPNVPADTVVQVIHAGFMIDERVLRPAAVIVAKGGLTSETPKPSPEKKDEPVPPGAMKVPDDVVTSPTGGPTSAKPPRPDVQQNVLGRDMAEQRRRYTNGSDDRVAPFRRPRSTVGEQTAREPRTQAGQNGPKPSPLHKPVIGSGTE